jgi:sugar transferase EpsL
MKTNLVKRTFDIFSASCFLLVISPLLLAISILIRLTMRLPIFFRQKRSGLKGKPFILLKFRTMTEERDEYGNLPPDIKRLTRLGRFLRRTSLDELPELFNVLKGEMSLVGPRPLLMQYIDRYTSEQAQRHEVKPGITGWAQINGRNSIPWDKKFEYDVWYVDHQSFWLDVKIIALTIWKILKSEGINQKGHATAEEFHPRIAPVKQGTKYV